MDAHAPTVAMYHDGTTDPVVHARRHMRLGLSEMQACHGLSSLVDYSPGAPRLAVSLSEALEETPALARARGCTAWLTSHPEDPSGMRAAAFVDESGQSKSRLLGVRLLVVDDPLPEVGVARAPRLLTSEDAVKSALVGGEDPFAVVDDPLARLDGGARLPDGVGVTALALGSEEPHLLDVRAEGTGAALVVVRTSYRVGWNARQEGRALPVVRVAGMFTGVVVDDVAAGEVLLRYDPPRLRLGIALSTRGALTFSALVFALVLTRIRAQTG
jgi:hypothetical protein